jgi:hemerythrin superfamily protein
MRANLVAKPPAHGPDRTATDGDTSVHRVARMAIEIPRPEAGDVVDLILEDHRLFEHLLRELRNEQNDRDALRRQMAELLVAHGEAEESKVYPQLERKDAIDEEEAEHGEKEHQEGYETLLPLLEASELYDEEFSTNLHEFSETLLHHLDEEERDILNPAREDVTDEERARLGAAWVTERNRMLEEGCGSLAQVRALVDGS